MYNYHNYIIWTNIEILSGGVSIISIQDLGFPECWIRVQIRVPYHLSLAFTLLFIFNVYLFEFSSLPFCNCSLCCIQYILFFIFSPVQSIFFYLTYQKHVWKKNKMIYYWNLNLLNKIKEFTIVYFHCAGLQDQLPGTITALS